MHDDLAVRARIDLAIARDEAGEDLVLWEHAQRVVGLTERILTLPEVSTRLVDRQALAAAAWYHDYGWVIDCRAGTIAPLHVLTKRTSETQRALAADWVERNLAAELSAAGAQTAARIIRECDRRKPQLFEAAILGDAERLEEIGPQAVWLMVRRQIALGKSLGDLLANWRRQEQYHYWQAWLRDGFHFPTARQWAEQRLEIMRRFTQELDQAHKGEPPADSDPAEAAGVRHGR